MPRDEPTQRQVDAARPDRSTWLSANAGSGKTTVLTNRVARLLLEGADPQHILCLTYTKAAATEMQNRLFSQLGTWAMLPDGKLAEALQELGFEGELGSNMLNRARRLFASAIETPGGLKIQTIHSFCSALLRRFPMEAGITPQFTEMEDRAATLLRTEIVEAIGDGPDSDTLYAMARHFSGEDFADLTADIVRHRDAFSTPLSDARLAELLSQPEDLSEDDITAQVFLGGERDILDALIPALLASSTTDEKAGKKLAGLRDLGFTALPVLEQVFLTGAGAKSPFSAKIGSFPTKPLRESLPALMPDLNAFMQRVEDARTARLALGTMQKTRALHAFARVFLQTYDATKSTRGHMDFDDLILTARTLLTDPSVAQWVLYRLDGGIDHILVDEAQDTSPAQWQVIELLAQEFTSGQGAHADIPRSIFVVGDKKQSIYSFQGADPAEFDRMKHDFAAKLQAVQTPLQDMEMEFSFRSSQAILALVDATFQGHEASGFTGREPHKAFKTDMPGRVDLWPVVEKPEKPEEPDWYDPVDTKSPEDPAIVLAAQVADAIKSMIDQPLPNKDGTAARPVHAGDILILVQRRSELFHEIIRACKERKLPVAGADRLRVGAELAVRDLGALLSFLATPEDSLSLACALRSPLFGWTEAQLYDLAQGRAEKYLWAELRNRADEFPETHAILRDLRDVADYLRPYEMIERILTRHDGRRNLLSRLGPEAEDGIDALLSQAMAYERNAVDSLTGFLVWMETDDLEIKRQMESAGQRVRVMTVHGAKGLESPIVILPDTAKRQARPRGQLAPIEDTVLWRPRADETPAAVASLNDAARAAELAERDRLLYVAMTRAENWLIVAAAGDVGKDGSSWYAKVLSGMTACNAAPVEHPGGQGLRLEFGNWDELETKEEEIPSSETPALPPFFNQPAPEPAPPTKTLSPSDLGGAKALPGERGLDEDAAKRRGRQVHRLLEFLPTVPPDDWPDTAARLLSRGEDAAEGEELALLLAETRKVLEKPILGHLFDPDALTEVPVTATLPALKGHRIHGTIDRLILTDDKILAVDFKTNAMIPDHATEVPDAILRQMGAYAHALAQIYPDRPVETAILWTRTATLMVLPHDLVTDTLLTTQIS